MVRGRAPAHLRARGNRALPPTRRRDREARRAGEPEARTRPGRTRARRHRLDPSRERPHRRHAAQPHARRHRRRRRQPRARSPPSSAAH